MFDELKLFVYDFDGVMTDNTVYVDEIGKESVRVHRGDGLAISLFKKQGFYQLILSTETNPVVKRRADKLHLPVISGSDNKLKALMDYCEESRFSLEQVLFIGNDLNDLEVMKAVGVAVCPLDACEEVKEIVDVVIEKKGGDGVIRGIYDLFLIYKQNNI